MVDTVPRSASRPGMPARAVPAPVVGRLPGYLQALEVLISDDVPTVSSEELAGMCGVRSAILRRDLSHLESAGRRGVGYECAALAATIREFLGVDRTRRIGIIGAGRLGSALADYAGIPDRGFALHGVFDIDPAVIGTTVGGVAVAPVAELARAVAAERIELIIIAVPASSAQAAADAAVDAGVRGLMSFAPVVLTVPSEVRVRHVDLATELQVLAYYTAAEAPDAAAAEPAAPRPAPGSGTHTDAIAPADTTEQQQ